MIVRLISTAGTGYFYTTTRLRLGLRLSQVKYDPKGRRGVCNPNDTTAKSTVTVKQRVLFVESKKTAKKGGK